MYALADSQVPILDEPCENSIFMNSYFQMVVCVIVVIAVLYLIFLLKTYRD
jgi:hypothetical protein